MTRSRVWTFRLALLAVGLAVPILPRAIVPLVADGPFTDTLAHLFASPLNGLFVLLWTAPPFAALAFMLRPGDDAPHARIPILASAALITVLGFVLHMPSRPGAGVNFGVAIFPFLAALVIAAVHPALRWLLARHATTSVLQ